MDNRMATFVTRRRRKPSDMLSPALGAVAPTSLTWPSRGFVPLVDAGVSASSGPYPQYDLPSAVGSLGCKFFQFGHVTADQNGEPVFAGYRLNSPWDRGLREQIAQLRAIGGDIAVSFGGADAGDCELACMISDVGRLTSAYERIVSAYGLRRIDFHIEGIAASDASINLQRAQAIAVLQQRRRAQAVPLSVTLSVAGLPTGLGADEIDVVDSAVRAGVVLSGVNMMAMNFGRAAAPHPAGRMGQYAIQAVRSAFGNLRELFDRHDMLVSDGQIWRQLGVTPMIGQNDVQGECFEPQDARELVDFAHHVGLGTVGLWSLNRDAQTGTSNYDSTGIDSPPNAFVRILSSYAEAAVNIRRPR